MNTSSYNTDSPKNEDEDIKESNHKRIADKNKYFKHCNKISVDVDATKLDLLSEPRTPIVKLKASSKISVEIVKTPNDHIEIISNEFAKNQPSDPNSTLRQFSKNSSEGSPKDEGSKAHFRKNNNKSTLILFGIALMFLFCNMPRLGVKIFLI